MPIRKLFLFFLLLTAISADLAGEPRSSAVQMPGVFEANSGQADDRYAFLGHGVGWTATFESTGFRVRQGGRTWTFTFPGAGTPHIEGVERLSAVASYYTGRSAEDWTLNVPLFHSVAYREVYPGVDVVFYQRDGRLEYDFLLEAGADPTGIRVAFATAEPKLTALGELTLSQGDAVLRQAPPRAFQTVADAEVEIPVRYSLDAAGRLAFELGPYRRDLPVRIDPLVYSTYVGGSQLDVVDAIGSDSDGAIYLAGRTFSRDFPTAGASMGNATSYLFVAKIDPHRVGAESLVAAAFLGVSDRNQVSFDQSGRAYIVSEGFSEDPALPMPAPEQAAQPERAGGLDAHLLVLNLSSDPEAAIEYATNLGGSGADTVLTLKLSQDGKALLHGRSDSVDFPLTDNAFGKVCSAGGPLGREWVAVIDPATPGKDGLLLSSCLDGFPRTDRTAALWEFDQQGRVHFALTTRQQGVTTASAFQPTPECSGCDSGLYALIDPAEVASLRYASHFGGAFREEVTALAIDAEDRAWVAGTTKSRNFPTTLDPIGAGCFEFEPDCVELPEPNAFVIGFDASASGPASRTFSTVIGGLAHESLDALLVRDERVVLVGGTWSSDFPTTESAYRRECLAGPNGCLVGRDIYLAEFRPLAAEPFEYATYLGSPNDEVFQLSPRGDKVFGWYGDQVLVMASVWADFPTTPGALERLHAEAGRNELVLFTVDTNRGGRDGLTYSTFLSTDDSSEALGAPVTGVRTSLIAGDRVLLGGVTTDPYLLTTVDALRRECDRSPSDDPDALCFSDGFVIALDPRAGPEVSLTPDVVELGYRVPDAAPDPVDVFVASSDPELRIRIRPGRGVSDRERIDFLNVEPRELTGSGSFRITPDVRYLVPGRQYEARILVESDDPALRRAMLVRIEALPVEPPVITAVVSSADFDPGAIAPGQIITVFGRNFGSVAGRQATLDNFGSLQDPIGITARVDGNAARVLFARHDQVNLVVSEFMEGPAATLSVQTQAGEASVELPVAASNPDLFTLTGTGVGQAAALNEDTSVNSAGRPAELGSIVVLYGTGDGVTDPFRQDRPAQPPLPRPILPVSATIGGRPAEVLFAGAAPGFVGLFQVNVRVPLEAPVGDSVPVVVTVGTNSSRADVTLAIRAP